MSSSTSHPYFPRSLQLPGYVPNTIPVQQILLGFGLTVGILILISLRLGRNLTVSDRWAMTWFVCCAAIHCILEGYFVVLNRSIASDRSVLGQVWKEYSLSDSRYLTSDPAVLSIEALTAFIVGPLSLAAARAILKGKPSRYWLQMVVCISQLYGCLLYYGTSWLTDFRDSRPDPQYFYGYFVLMNLPWVAVPLLLIRSSYHAITKQFSIGSGKKTK